jgi:hypothetical protein
MIFVEKITSSKHIFSNGFNILAVDAYSGMELCTPTWLNHDYGDGRVVDILAVDAYPEWRYARQYFWVRLAISVGGKSFLTFFKTQMDTSLNKAQHKQELLCG